MWGEYSAVQGNKPCFIWPKAIYAFFGARGCGLDFIRINKSVVLISLENKVATHAITVSIVNANKQKADIIFQDKMNI